jgi:serine/threonine protein kinase
VKHVRDGRLGAVKLLHKNFLADVKRTQRFSDEMRAMEACKDINGVLPMLALQFDESSSGNEPWYVTPFAEPYAEYSEKLELTGVVEMCFALATTLAAMHERGISHRDIKPENILRYQDRWCLTDLGLTDFPGKSDLTLDGEKLGPLHYIAPEMLNSAASSDGRAADVYSFGKLIWKMATGQRYPLPGAQSAREPAFTISAYVSDPRAYSLDGIVEAATQMNPNKRPSMKVLSQSLATWLQPQQKPQGSTDLSVFTERVVAATQKYERGVQTRREIQQRADSERQRVFLAFSNTLDLIRDEIRKAKIGRVRLDNPEGGNGDFYYAVTNNQHVGRGGEGTWLFQFSVSTTLQDDRRRAVLLCGVNIGVRNVVNESGPLHDIYSPALMAAGFLLRTSKFIGDAWTESERLLWGESDFFLFGQPSEMVLVDRLNAQLQGHLVNSVRELVTSYELMT